MKNGHGAPRVVELWHRFLARWPQFCCFCHRKTESSRDLCHYCQSYLPPITINSANKPPSTLCLGCGFCWPDSYSRQECAFCVNTLAQIELIICPYRYDFPIDKQIQRLKYQQHLPTGRLLGSLLAVEVQRRLEVTDYPDWIVPVPLNRTRYRQRGFNQAAEIARWCASSLGIDSLPTAAGRRFETTSLVGLSRAERELNIVGVFEASECLKGARVAIVDDVMTTGSTAGELARELLDTGVADVQLWVVARTPITGTAGGS